MYFWEKRREKVRSWKDFSKLKIYQRLLRIRIRRVIIFFNSLLKIILMPIRYGLSWIFNFKKLFQLIKTILKCTVIYMFEEKILRKELNLFDLMMWNHLHSNCPKILICRWLTNFYEKVPFFKDYLSPKHFYMNTGFV